MNHNMLALLNNFRIRLLGLGGEQVDFRDRACGLKRLDVRDLVASAARFKIGLSSIIAANVVSVTAEE